MSSTRPGSDGPAARAPRRLPVGVAAAPLVLGILATLTAFFVVGGLLGLVLGALTAFLVLGGLAGLILGFSALGRTTRGGAGGRGLAVGTIVAGAVALVLALLLGLLVAVPVGAFFTRYRGELADLDDCVQAAGDDQTKIRACQDDFARKVSP